MASEAVEHQVLDDDESETTDVDRRTGYYIAGHDWPAISNGISLAKIYTALSQISDDAVGAALDDVSRTEGCASSAGGD